jgi:magnesium-transporting ATPase (P-type)
MPSLDDLLFALGQWLRTTQLPELSLWIQKQPLSMLIDRNFWAIPIIQTIHILAIAAAFGSVVMINLRIFGLAGQSRTMTQTARRYLPWVWWALATLLVTGLAMVVGEPVRELTNPVFWIKMILVIFAALVSLWFQGSVRRNLAWWELTHERRVLIRAGAAAIIVLWCVIMACGRYIAYAPT